VHLDLPTHTHDLYIAPLLLLPLVENCFKHGASNLLDQPWVNLQVRVEGQQVQVKLLNGKPAEMTGENGHEGIGLDNVRKRLDLIYPGRYEFTINNEADVFIVNLKVELEQVKEVGMPLKNSQPIAIHA
jgi:LytS/YehU family sensor histidine kinase